LPFVQPFLSKVPADQSTRGYPLLGSFSQQAIRGLKRLDKK
jgi:hypothetical protein